MSESKDLMGQGPWREVPQVLLRNSLTHKTNVEPPWPLELKVNINTITLNVIYKYIDVRKNYPEQSSQVADWRQVNDVNRGVLAIAKKM